MTAQKLNDAFLDRQFRRQPDDQSALSDIVNNAAPSVKLTRISAESIVNTPITGQEWKQVEAELKSLHGKVSFKIDSYDITLMRQHDNKNIFTAVYVNGHIYGADCGIEVTEINRRFYKPRSKYICRMKPGQDRAKEIKRFKRLSMQGAVEYLSARITLYMPFWQTFGPLKKHLMKNNQHIQLVGIGYGTNSQMDNHEAQ